MKKRIFSAVMALIILLSCGCSSMLSRSYSAVTQHSATPTSDGDPSTLKVERYQDLVNGLLYLVTLGRESGTLRLYMDSDSVETNLDAACLEVVQESPMGAYAVDFIKYSVSPSVAYWEAEVQITYRRTPEQVASIVSVTGSTAIRGELKSALSEFAPESVMRISYFDGDESYIQQLVEEAYYATPATALDLPEITAYVYPDTGRQRIVEILLSYHLSLTQLEDRRDALEHAVAQVILDFSFMDSDSDLLALSTHLLETSTYDPDGGSTAYHAMVERNADSEGLALAMSSLCQALDIPCYVVKGTLDENVHFWNVVQTETGYQHIDLSRGVPDESAFLSDGEIGLLGYKWDMTSLPQCNVRPDRTLVMVEALPS